MSAGVTFRAFEGRVLVLWSDTAQPSVVEPDEALAFGAGLLTAARVALDQRGRTGPVVPAGLREALIDLLRR